jgi:nicotinate-nucleotide--dimethylbenzimidazole phosphoribosyltransferase
MGIGNTTSAALLMHRLAPAPLADCVGAGAGLDAAGVARKLAVAEKAASRSDATSPLDVLAEFGGYEIAMMAGAVLGSAARRRPVIIDGFIATAAALVAVRLQPAARGYCVFSHRSAERGHALLLEALDAKPYLDLGLRLGEGTGAVMAVPLLRAAAGILTGMADLADVLAGKFETLPADRQHG